MNKIFEYIEDWTSKFGENATKYSRAIQATIKSKSFQDALADPRNASKRSYIDRKYLGAIDTWDLGDVRDFICGDHFCSNEELELVGNERAILCEILRDEWKDRL